MITQILQELGKYPEFQIDLFESRPELNFFSMGVYTPAGVYKIEKPLESEYVYIAKGWSHKGDIKWSDAAVKLTNVEDLVKIMSD